MEKNKKSRYEGQHQHKKLYASKTWQQLRRIHLDRQPLCQECKRQGRLTLGNTVHHLKPHGGAWSLFNNADNLETLCSSCHSGSAQQQERIGYASTVGNDGWPTDNKHPFNKR